MGRITVGVAEMIEFAHMEGIDTLHLADATHAEGSAVRRSGTDQAVVAAMGDIRVRIADALILHPEFIRTEVGARGAAFDTLTLLADNLAIDRLVTAGAALTAMVDIICTVTLAVITDVKTLTADFAAYAFNA